jgi:segregation and condensation protein A
MAYRVHLEKFEGPLDLLLTLIEKEKLDITQVSLAQVADQYLEYLQENTAITLQHMAGFLTIAARLILIKSRALLPVLQFTDDEEESIEDLEYHLRAYKLFREASRRMGQLFMQAQPAFVRESFQGMPVTFYPPKDVSADVLKKHFVSVLGDIPIFEILPKEEIATVISLEERITHLQQSLSERTEASFHEMIRNAEDRVEVIVSFLALLELIKQRFIHVEQDGYFSAIRIKKIS